MNQKDKAKLHREWDGLLPKEMVDLFVDNAELFKDPDLIDLRILTRIESYKESRGTDEDIYAYDEWVSCLYKMAIENRTASQEALLKKMAEMVDEYVNEETMDENNDDDIEGVSKFSSTPKSYEHLREKWYGKLPKQMVDLFVDNAEIFEDQWDPDRLDRKILGMIRLMKDDTSLYDYDILVDDFEQLAIENRTASQETTLRKMIKMVDEYMRDDHASESQDDDGYEEEVSKSSSVPKSYEHLREKWYGKLPKEMVDLFVDNAEMFEDQWDPDRLDRKILKHIRLWKDNPSWYKYAILVDEYEQLAIENRTTSQEATLRKMIKMVDEYLRDDNASESQDDDDDEEEEEVSKSSSVPKSYEHLREKWYGKLPKEMVDFFVDNAELFEDQWDPDRLDRKILKHIRLMKDDPSFYDYDILVDRYEQLAIENRTASQEATLRKMIKMVDEYMRDDHASESQDDDEDEEEVSKSSSTPKSYEHLREKWYGKLPKEMVDLFVDNAEMFEDQWDPDRLDRKILKHIRLWKDNPSWYKYTMLVDEYEQLAIENRTTSQEATLRKMIKMVDEYITGKSEKKEKKQNHKGKSQQTRRTTAEKKDNVEKQKTSGNPQPSRRAKPKTEPKNKAQQKPPRQTAVSTNQSSRNNETKQNETSENDIPSGCMYSFVGGMAYFCGRAARFCVQHKVLSIVLLFLLLGWLFFGRCGSEKDTYRQEQVKSSYTAPKAGKAKSSDSEPVAQNVSEEEIMEAEARLENLFDDVTRYDSYFEIEKADKYGIADLKGNVKIEPTYDYIDVPNTDLGIIEVHNNDKYGMVSLQTLEEVVPTQFDFIGMASDDSKTIEVRVDEKYGLLSSENIELIAEPIYDYIGIYEEKTGLMEVRKDDKYGLFSPSKKKEVAPCIYDNIYYSGGLYQVRKGDKEGYLNEDGTVNKELQ